MTKKTAKKTAKKKAKPAGRKGDYYEQRAKALGGKK